MRVVKFRFDRFFFQSDLFIIKFIQFNIYAIRYMGECAQEVLELIEVQLVNSKFLAMYIRLMQYIPA